jgi:hypothetical protein
LKYSRTTAPQGRLLTPAKFPMTSFHSWIECIALVNSDDYRPPNTLTLVHCVGIAGLLVASMSGTSTWTFLVTRI